MKIYKLIFFAYLFLVSSLASDEKLDFSFGFVTNLSEAQEKVFDSGRLLSLLQWPILPSFSLHFDAGLHLPYFHINFETSVGFPAFSGFMKDSDYTDPHSTKKTLFSNHKTKLNQNISISSLIGVPFKASSKQMEENHQITVELEPELGFYFSLKNWHAKDGYTQYKSADGSKYWNKNWPKEEYKGKGVKYVQKMFFPFIAFQSKVKIKNKLNIAIGTSFSPLLQAISYDTHFDKEKIYIDIFSLPSYAFELKTIFERKISQKIFFYSHFSFLYYRSNRGKTFILEEKSKQITAHYAEGSSGMEGKEFKLIFGIRCKF